MCHDSPILGRSSTAYLFLHASPWQPLLLICSTSLHSQWFCYAVWGRCWYYQVNQVCFFIPLRQVSRGQLNAKLKGTCWLMAATFSSTDGRWRLLGLPGHEPELLLFLPVVVFRFMAHCLTAGGKSVAAHFKMRHWHLITCVNVSVSSSPICGSRLFCSKEL